MSDKVYTVLGLMTGTSLDGVDAAFLETDGERIIRFGPGMTGSYASAREAVETATKAALQWRFNGPPPNQFAEAEAAIDAAHADTIDTLCAAHPDWAGRLDLIGYHGQTILHHPPLEGQRGQTLQLGTGAALASRFGVPIVYDFRSADVAAGGQGAPLAPIYHQALCVHSGLVGVTAVLNLGGVGNVTLVGTDVLMASDTGPANGPLDSWMQRHGVDFDQDGATALSGQIDFDRVEQWLVRDFFKRPIPRSADRYDFDVLDDLAGQSLEDGAATLAAFTTQAVRRTLGAMPFNPDRVILCGGGRHNSAMRYLLREDLACPVLSAEDTGWDADMIEAQAFAYLAVRLLKGLPISFPETTNVPRPMTGGRLVKP